METMREAAPGLRERKKAATRQALHEAAMRLTIDHGLDHVTVEAIADAAGVSRRTFSNYFEGKEDALLYGDAEWRRRVVEALAARPADERGWPALRATVRDQFGDLTLDPYVLRQAKLVRSHPSLIQRQLARFAELEARIAELVAVREGLPPDALRARVLSAAFLTALRVGVQRWAVESPERPLQDVVEETLDEIGTAF
ncbi:TetR/AcrR family transcriptional regulator [Actinomadura atramentaria]|uniref:TetR/AcrR family transcriptional regulator n=1 Tax=Actinomadura atramentaria TaxID=1990 RepID=UPI000382DD30|nr:TetR family transcriptional regulator [Actinomadura atramentaria]